MTKISDSWLDLNTVDLLGRVDSRIDKADLIREVSRIYDLGRVKKYSQIHEGFEDYNVKLITSKGTFLVKVFSQFKSFRHVKDNIRGLVEFKRAGVKVPKLFRNLLGENLFYYETRQTSALVCVMEYFKGKSFLKWGAEPSVVEIRELVKNMVKINLTKFKPLGIYDVWSAINLNAEYSKKKEFLSPNDLELMKDYAKWIGEVDFGKYHQGTIHGDLQRSNILKNKQGELRIIDFSVMEHNAVVIELAVFLGLFCLNPMRATNPEEVKQVFDLVIEEYGREVKLSKAEIAILPKLVGATYAINCLAASYELKGKGNKSEETRYWVELGSKGMKMIKELG